jgi:hypothetical protein
MLIWPDCSDVDRTLLRLFCGSFILDLLGDCDGKIARDASSKAAYQE